MREICISIGLAYSWKEIHVSNFRAVASKGQELPLPPPGPIEPDKLILWMDLFSSHLVILIVVTFNSLPFSWPRNWLVCGVCK